MAAAKKGGGGGGVMTGPRGGRYIVHGGNKHYLRKGESPSQAAVRVGAGVSPSAKGRVLAQKAKGKFNAGQERQMKKVEASYAKDVARNKAAKGGGAGALLKKSAAELGAGMKAGKVTNVGAGSAAAQKAAKEAAAEVRAEKAAAKGVKNAQPGVQNAQPGAANKPARPKFDAMADAEAHIAKLKAESAAKNAAKVPAAIGGYGGPPPAGVGGDKPATKAAAQAAGKAGPGFRNGKDHVAELAKAGMFGGKAEKGKAVAAERAERDKKETAQVKRDFAQPKPRGGDPHAARWAAGKSVPTSYGVERLAKEMGVKVQRTVAHIKVDPSDHPLVKASRASEQANKSGSKADHAAAAKEIHNTYMTVASAASGLRGAKRAEYTKLMDRLVAERDAHNAKGNGGKYRKLHK